MDQDFYDELLKRLTALVVKLDERDDQMMALHERHLSAIEELREFNRQQHAITERLTAAIERLDVTQARIETLLARMIQQSENGREA
jgi:hypothetical protein